MDNNRFAVLKTNTFKSNDSRKSTKETNYKSNETRKMENTFKNNNFKKNNSFNRPNMSNNHRNNFMNYTEKKEEKKPEFNFNNDDFPSLG
mgnify:CR=1 FL=1